MHPDPFDPQQLSIPTNSKPATLSSRSRSGPRRKADFLKGPIPWSWLSAAMRLPGKALAVGVLVWHLSALRRKRVVKWEPRIARPIGLCRQTIHRGFAALEQAGLIRVERHTGRCPTITILDCEEKDV